MVVGVTFGALGHRLLAAGQGRMASFQSQSGLPVGCPSAKPWKKPWRSCQAAFAEHQHGLAAMGRFEAPNAVAIEQGCMRLWLAHPLARPGRSQGFADPDKLPTDLALTSQLATAGPTCAARARGCLDQAHRAPATCSARAATGRASTRRTSTTTSTRLSLGGLGVVPFTCIRGPRLQIARCFWPSQAREGCRRIAGLSGSACRSTSTAWRPAARA